MEPQIHYAKTTDGVNIAWYAIGEGSPYLWPAAPGGVGIAELWRIPEMRNLFEGMARRSRLVVCDPRGFGLSDQGAVDFSCDALVRDLEAVADAAIPERFTLQAFGLSTIPLLSYAARHPERVLALVLLNGILRTADMSEQSRRMLRLAHEDWEFWKIVAVRSNEPSYASTATLEQTQELFDRAVSRDAWLAFHDAAASWDVSDLAGRVETPAIVVHYGQSTSYPLEACRRLAASLPNGTLASADPGEGAATRVDSVTSIVRNFLRGVLPAEVRRGSRTMPSAAGTSVILFTDIADSTALTEHLGDSAFRAASRALDERVRETARATGGTPVEGKVLGDGVMGVFSSAAQAIDAARRCASLGGEAGLPMHIGLHAGDVLREAGNVYGGAVNIASRICGLCEPGEILVSATVRDLARTSAGVAFDDRGEHGLKGIEDPVRLFAVRWRE